MGKHLIVMEYNSYAKHLKVKFISYMYVSNLSIGFHFQHLVIVNEFNINRRYMEKIYKSGIGKHLKFKNYSKHEVVPEST